MDMLVTLGTIVIVGLCAFAGVMAYLSVTR